MKLSLVIPTYNEKENIQKLLSLLKEEYDTHRIDGEVIVVDDNSPDGTGHLLEELKATYPSLTVIHRQGKLGLSSAVVEGFRASKGDILGVMDADLSHPVQKIHEMFSRLTEGSADLVIGSRYIPGGRIEGWNTYRKVLSKGATFLARVFVSAKDPMSGFFLIKRACVLFDDINPKGFKILLELLIKTNCRVVEVPITFVNRTAGKSKAGLKEILYYLRNLASYLRYERKVAREFFKFAVVGLGGTVVNIGILYSLTEYFNVYYILSALIAFCIALTFNFICNTLWTFGDNMRTDIARKYSSFFLVSVCALLVNIVFLYIFTEFLRIYYIVSQVIAIGIALMINFIGNKIWTFRE